MPDILSREIQRKTVHFLAGSLIPVVYYFLNRENAVIGLSIITTVLLLIEWMRLMGKIRLPDILLRPHENNRVAAYVYFPMAALISILVFEKAVAVAALLMLAVGDTASGIAGAIMKGGNVRSDNSKLAFKPLPIIAIMFAVCIMVGIVLLYLPKTADMVNLSFMVYAAGAVGATLGDAVPVRFRGNAVDDNLIIPMLSGLFMTAARFT